MYLPVQRYEQIKHEVVDMYEECEISTFPIDCFDIASKLYYILVPYSKLNDYQLRLAMEYSSEGFSVLRKVPETGMYRYYIFYNDYNSYERQRWTIFHEIGHIYLGHHLPDCTLTRDEQESEANFFAKYSIAPPPLINTAKCDSPWEIAATFFVSEQASVYIFIYFQKWLNYGPPDYEEYELEMLSQFGIAA